MSYEELGRPVTPGKYALPGVGLILIDREDLEEWCDMKFASRMMVVRGADGPTGEREWHFIGWDYQKKAA